VVFAADGSVIIDEQQYFLGGWSIRNMRWADTGSGGSHLFPDAGQLISDLTIPAVRNFLARAASRSRHPFPMGSID
jgi:hypothetical protein